MPYAIPAQTLNARDALVVSAPWENLVGRMQWIDSCTGLGGPILPQEIFMVPEEV